MIQAPLTRSLVLLALLGAAPIASLAQQPASSRRIYQLPPIGPLTGSEAIPIDRPNAVTGLSVSPDALAAYVGGKVTTLQPGAAAANLGFAPVNKAGDTMTGALGLPAPVASANDNNATTNANSQNRLSHVANAAALATWTNYAFPVERDDVGIIYTDTGASCTNADGFAQVQPATGHCWQVVAGSKWSPRIWGANGGDDSAAWSKALAYLGTLGNVQELIDDVPSATISVARLVIPSNVAVRGLGEYLTQSSLSTLNFTNPNGGFYVSTFASVRNIHFIGSSSVDHYLESGGQVSIRNNVFDYFQYAIRSSKTIVPGLSGASSNAVPTGLAAGTYNGIAFTGGGGSGATLSITVNSSGVVTATFFSAGGTGYSPWFDYGFAAGAVYSGSPAVAVVGQIDTVNMGRSVISDNFFISNLNGTSNTGYAMEIDGAYDFVECDNNEVWSPAGLGQSLGTAFRLGHVDGLSMKNPKAFGIYKGIDWSAPTTQLQSFGTIVGAQLDGVYTGVSITFPLAQLAITGGYTRSLFKPLYVNSPPIQLTVTGHAFYTLADNVQFADFGQLNFTGNSFSTNALGGGGFTELYVGAGNGTPTGAGNGYIGGNTFDGRVPGIAIDATVKGVTVGANRWPGRQYSGGTGFLTNGSPGTTVLPMTGGQITLSTDANGKVTIPWNIGFAPQQPTVQIIGAAAAGGYRAAVVSTGSESMSVQIFTAAGAVAASGISVTIAWGA